MQVDNVFIWDKEVLVAPMVAGLEINFSRSIVPVIHERALKTSTTYPFVCLNFQLCRVLV